MLLAKWKVADRVGCVIANLTPRLAIKNDEAETHSNRQQHHHDHPQTSLNLETVTSSKVIRLYAQSYFKMFHTLLTNLKRTHPTPNNNSSRIRLHKGTIKKSFHTAVESRPNIEVLLISAENRWEIMKIFCVFRARTLREKPREKRAGLERSRHRLCAGVSWDFAARLWRNCACVCADRE